MKASTLMAVACAVAALGCRPDWDDLAAEHPQLDWAGSPAGVVGYARNSGDFFAVDDRGHVAARWRETGTILSVRAGTHGWQVIRRRDDRFELVDVDVSDVRVSTLPGPALEIWDPGDGRRVLGWNDLSVPLAEDLLVSPGLVYRERPDGGFETLELAGVPEALLAGRDELDRPALIAVADGRVHLFRDGDDSPTGTRVPLSERPEDAAPLRWVAAGRGRVFALHQSQSDLFVIRVPAAGGAPTLNLIALGRAPAAIHWNGRDDELVLIEHDDETVRSRYDLVDERWQSQRLPTMLPKAQIAAVDDGLLYWQAQDRSAVWEDTAAGTLAAFDWGIGPSHLFAATDATFAVAVHAYEGGAELAVADPSAGRLNRYATSSTLDMHEAALIAGVLVLPSRDSARTLLLPLDGSAPRILDPEDWFAGGDADVGDLSPAIPAVGGLFLGTRNDVAVAGGGALFVGGERRWSVRRVLSHGALDAVQALP